MSRDHHATIRALLTTAGHPATSTEEAQNALARVAEMMIRHDISAASLTSGVDQEPDAVVTWPYALAARDGLGQARAMIAYRIAEAFGAKAVLIDGKTAHMTTIVGTQAMITSLRTLLPLAVTCAGQALIRNVQGRPNLGLNHARSFLIAYGQAVATRVAERRRRVLRETPARAGEVATRSDQDRIMDTYRQLFGDKIRDTTVRGMHGSGSAAGQRAGGRLDLGDNLGRQRGRAALNEGGR